MKKLLASFFLVLLFATVAQAQNNACFGADPTGNVVNPKVLNLVLAEHTTNNPNNQPIVNNYTLNIMEGTTTTSSVTIPKTSFTSLPGVPSNCYSLTLPAFSGVLPNKLYKIGMIANGSSISSAMGVSTQSFFLEAVPTAPASLRLTVLRMLSKMYQVVLSTVDSKSWFQPIGK